MGRVGVTPNHGKEGTDEGRKQKPLGGYFLEKTDDTCRIPFYVEPCSVHTFLIRFDSSAYQPLRLKIYKTHERENG